MRKWNEEMTCHWSLELIMSCAQTLLELGRCALGTRKGQGRGGRPDHALAPAHRCGLCAEKCPHVLDPSCKPRARHRYRRGGSAGITRRD